jgi:membrane fusion protein, heavy metal efflux system
MFSNAVRTLLIFRSCAVIFLCFLSAAAFAHEGEDHGAPPTPVSTTIAPRAESASADFELVAVSRGKMLEIYLDRYQSNEPVQGATIDVDVAGEVLRATENGAGLYSLEVPALVKTGKHDLAFTLQTADTVDILTATLTVPEPPAAAPVVTSPAATWLAHGQSMVSSLGTRLATFDKVLIAGTGGGFLVGVLLMALFRRKKAGVAPATIAAIIVLMTGGMPDQAVAESGAQASVPQVIAPAVAARDIAQRFPDGAVFVPKATQRVLALRTTFTEEANHPLTVDMPGRIIPDPNGSGVVQAAMGGRLIAPQGGFPRLGTPVKAGDVLGTVVPVLSAADTTGQAELKSEIEQSMSIVEKRLKRWRSIPNLVPRQRVEEAELEMSGLKSRLAALKDTPREAEKLIAPVDGVIASVQAVSGQIADPNVALFHIVDPKRFWIEALSYEALALGDKATAQLADGRSFELIYRGTGLAERAQAVTIHFEISGDITGLRSGQFLSILANTTEQRTGIAVPRASVLRRANGQSVVYERTNAERFVPREVRVLPLDAERVLIVSGIEAKKRIVTQGAELLNQIR